MKKTIIISILAAFSLSLRAAVLTVSNDPNQPAQWSNLQTAINSANAGDTLYVLGSPNNYGSITLTKRLHLIGAGIKPVGNTLYGFPTTTDWIYLDTVAFISGASGTIIEGFTAVGVQSFSGSQNLILRRNRFTSQGSFSVNNVLIVNNIFQSSLILSNVTNAVIMNNIFRSYIAHSSVSTLISNNVFLYNGGAVFSSCVNSTITNNIFYYSQVTGSSYCTFSNNIGFGISTPVLQGSNSGSGNINADPKFVYKYTGNSSHDLDDYTLQATSPGKNAGTDGKDIGIFGGEYPWPSGDVPLYIIVSYPGIPVMRELSIQNASVPANGTLNFSVKAFKTTR